MDLTPVELGDFPSGETSVRIEESIRGKHIFVIQSHAGHVHPNTAIMEHLLLIHTARSASVSEVTAVMPYMGYMRQDKKTDGRVAESAGYIVSLLTDEEMADRLVGVDLHSEQIQLFTKKPFDHFFASPVLTEDIQNKFSDEIANRDLVIVSPDVGRTAFAGKMQRKLGLEYDDMAIVNKRRSNNNAANGIISNSSSTHGIIGSVKDKVCILLDDMVDTAGTLCGAAEILMNEGEAKEVYAYATHPVLSTDKDGVSALDKIGESDIKELVVTDTLPILQTDHHGKVRQISMTHLVALAIRRIAGHRSVSKLFE